MLYVGARRSLLKRRGDSAPIWTPAANFPLGTEPGLWYDPSTFTGLYQDSAGTSPATATGQPNGLMLDKRLGLVLGPELAGNGSFNDASVWGVGTAAVAIAGGAAVFTNEAAAQDSLYQIGITPNGRYYEVTYTITEYTSGGIRFQFGNFQAGTARTAAGTYTQRVMNTLDGNANFIFKTTTSSTTLKIDNISVKQILGNHSSQATASARPLINARVNLLMKTSDLTNAAWIKRGTATVSNTPAPDGTGQLVSITSTNNELYQVAPTSFPAAMRYEPSVKIWPVTVTGILLLQNPHGGSSRWDINMALLTAGAWNSLTRGHPAVTVTSEFATAPDAGAGLMLIPNDGVNKQFYLKQPQVQVGTVSGPYQRVNTATDYDTVGFPQFGSFDGLDDGMSTGAITLGSDMDCFIAVRRNSAIKGIIAGKASQYFAYFEPPANPYLTYSGVGSNVTYLVNGITVGGGTEVKADVLGSSLPVGAWCVLEVRNLNLSGWADFSISSRVALPLNGDIAGVILCPAGDAAARQKNRQYLGAKVGLTLP